MVMPETIEAMDANTARTLNIRRLIEESGGPAEWARRYGGDRWTQPQVSQWISESRPKGIGRALARDLEVAMNLSSGALDRPVGRESHSLGLDVGTLDQAIRLLQMVMKIRGLPPIPSIDATQLAVAYETVQAEARSLEESNVFDFMKAFVERLEQKERKNGVERGSTAGSGTAVG